MSPLFGRRDLHQGTGFDSAGRLSANMNQLLQGKNVLITGAGYNIGRYTALEMAEQGANIYFTEINAERTANVEAELRATGAMAQGFVVDGADPAAIERLVDELKRLDVGIDVLVNNVGIGTSKPNWRSEPREVTRQSFENWQKVMDTNVLGPVYLTRLLAQDMAARRIAGSIIFITSVHQWIYRGDMVYSATKAGLGMIIDELAVSLAKFDIRVNGIAPGGCYEKKDGTPPPHIDVPLYQQMVHPRYIGRAAIFLASDYFSHHTTGTVLKVDGGLSLNTYLVHNMVASPNWREGQS